MNIRLLILFLFALTVNVNAQSFYMSEMAQYEWHLSYIIINGETIQLPTDPPGLQNVSLAIESSNGLNSNWYSHLNYGGNSLAFNADFDENEPSFILNGAGVTLMISPWPSFENFYFSGVFLNYGNSEQANPFNFSIIYLGDAASLVITNNLGNSAHYWASDLSIPKGKLKNMDVLVNGNNVEFIFLNEVEIEKSEIFNMQGQKVDFLYQTGITSYSIEQLPKGIYIVQVYGSDTSVFRKKIVIQ